MREWYRFVCYYSDVARLYDTFECVACVDGDADGGFVYGDDGENSSYGEGGVYEDDVWTGYGNDDDDGGDDYGACFCHHSDGDGVVDDGDDGDNGGGDDEDEDDGGGSGDGDNGGKSFVPAFSWGQPPLL